ncbi:methylthioribulose 1-phosphate dehydratase [Bacillus mangrovi]|uniref:Methylthioribulose-1-phosphate dehydratase n=1 Tax=Metabacillus mangrovi TaxID=1491830 RepID=A0A7X2V5K9_9BACI|nr:methylthioribulose 1-phosphate dehydratase [Metabacillus mangrovi]MTH54286.1 methylthioribulose 1-phosphate dehydratase [Metabacillus mangrovi]
MRTQLDSCWRELAEVKRELAQRDWFPATSGNLAIKAGSNPLTFYVTASGKDKRKETAEDFLLVDQHGQPAEETDLRPSAETLLHTEVYSRTEAGCSLHVHTIDNNIISELYAERGYVTFTGQEIIKAFGLWDEDASFTVPIIPNYADIPALAKEFGKHVREDAGAVLIRNHGITVWGRDAFEAKKYLEACEFLFSYHVKLLQCRNFQ